MVKHYRKYIEVSYKICQFKWQKRSDGIKEWNGKCKKCRYVDRFTDAAKIQISKALIGRFTGRNHPNWVEPKLCIDCHIPLSKKSGKDKRPVRCKKCFDVFNRKENHWNWQNGLSNENHLIRNSVKYKGWAKAVKERDNYTCVICNKKGGELHSDHIQPFSLYPDLRFEISNGRTLCKPCHQNYGWNLFKENNPRKPVQLKQTG